MKDIKEFFVNNKLEIKQKNFLLAVSGGPDSMALLDLIRSMLDDPQKQIIVAHFDHQLRVDSKQESELIGQYCHKYKLELVEKKWNIADQPNSGIEAAARQYRYAFFKEIIAREKINYLLTAHHGDDLVENILLKLLRSGNVQEMNSLVEVGKFEDTNAYLLRPLLKYSKAELLAYVKKHKINYINDSTNFEDNTLRNRLRHHVVPLLRNESNNLIENANRFQKSETELEDSQEILFKNLTIPKRKYETWTGNLEDLKLLDLNQKRLYFEWLSLNKFQQRVHFDELKQKVNFHTRKDGIELVFYQNRYYLYRVNELNNELVAPFKVNLNKVFTFKKKQYIISRQNLSFRQIGEFFGDDNLNLLVGSLPIGQKLILAKGKKTKAKKKFAEKSIPSALRPACLTVMEQKADNAVEVEFIADVYRKQDYNSSYVRYIIYEV